jgi:hypothetical protein
MPKNTKDIDIMVKVLEENHDTKTNADIAKILKVKYYKYFGHKTSENLRRRIGELRRDLGFAPSSTIAKSSKEKEPEIIKVTNSDLEINRSDWTKSQIGQETLRKEVSQSKKEKKILSEELADIHRQLEVAMELKKHEVQRFPIKEAKGDPNSEAVAVIVGSDWHYEERIDSETVNGLNYLTPDISNRRIQDFFRGGVRLVEVTGRDIKINHIVLALLGDLIHGYIHDDLVESNYMSPINASMKVQEQIINGIDYILDKTKCHLTVPCKIGNHGRTTEKRRISTASQNSYEFYMYHNIANHYRQNDRVQFIIEDSYLTYLDIFDKYKIRFHHGEVIRYQGGIGGVTIPASKKINNYDKEIKAYLDVFGHFHTQMLDTGSHKFVLNGSLCGYNPYAISIGAAFEPPRQAFFLIDKKRGKTISAPICVE